MSIDFQLGHPAGHTPAEQFPFDLPRMGIYAIRNTKDGRVYVGQSRRIRGRWRDHVKDLRFGGGPPKLQEGWDECGPGCFDFMVLEQVLDPSLLQGREQHFMDVLNAVTTGYNTLPMAGSFAGYTPDAAARAKIGAASKKRWEDPEFRRKILQGLQESDYTPTLEHRRRLSEVLRDVPRGPLTNEHRVNISRSLQGSAPVAATEAWTGQHHTEETKRKIGEANRGKPCPDHVRALLKARRLSEATKSKIGAAMRGRPWSAARRAAYEKSRSEKEVT